MVQENAGAAAGEGTRIRMATPDDAERLLQIYAPYVRDTAITFEWDVPSVEDFRQRIARTLERYPYLVAESADGQALGYAYAGPLKERKAYDWACELSIYVAQDAHGHGVGAALYATLERLLSAMGVTNLNACIGYPAAPDDPYLTRASVEFHTHLGFEWVGRFHGCGYKFGRWYDMVWMEKIVGDHPADALPLRPVSQVAALLGK